MILEVLKILIAATIGVIIAKKVLLPWLDRLCTWLCDLF